MADILALLKGVRRNGKGWTAICPAHEDKQSSLSVAHRDAKWLLKCHAGCAWEAVIAALELKAGDLFDEEHVQNPPEQHATAQPLGLTLEQYAAVTALPVDFLRECGLSDMVLAGRSAVRIPYLGPSREELAVRFRIALDGDCFRWKSGSKPCLYGLNRFGDAQAARDVVLVEGEANVHTLWHHGIPAVGLPGVIDWREDRDAKCFNGVETIYIVVGAGKSEQVRKWLGQSAIRARAKLLELPADLSAMHITDSAGFKRAWQVALLGSVSWTVLEAQQRAEERLEAWDLCAELARSENILGGVRPDSRDSRTGR